MPLSRPARCSSIRTPIRSSNLGSLGPADMTPIEPTIEDGATTILWAAMAAR